VVAETVDYLSLAIVSVTALLNPEVIVLGGGVARSADLLVEPPLPAVRNQLTKDDVAGFVKNFYA
jgi:glucokinase